MLEHFLHGQNFIFFLSFCGTQRKKNNNDEKEPLEPLTYVSTLDVVYQWFRDFFLSRAMLSSFTSYYIYIWRQTHLLAAFAISYVDYLERFL